MLAVVFLIPTVFGIVMFVAVRRNRAREAKGEGFRPEGKIRWNADDLSTRGS